MAVYQGARPRAASLPGGVLAPGLPRRADVPTIPRRRARVAVRARRGPNRAAIALGVIVVAFMLAFFSLAQSVRVSATSYDIGRLEVAQDRLEAQIDELDSDLSRLGREPAVRKIGLDGGLTQLDYAVVLPAR